VHPAEQFFRKRFRQCGTAARAAGEKAYLKSPLRFHGVTMPDIRAAARDYCRLEPALDRARLREIVGVLYSTDFHDLRSAGVCLLERNVSLLRSQDAPWLVELIRQSANWAHLDWLAANVLGTLVTRDPKLHSKLRR
jgi:hypothetical protein